MKSIIFVSGQTAAGKDTVAEHIAKKYFFTHVKTSDIAKKICAEKSCTFEALRENSDFYQAILNEMGKHERVVVSGAREPKILKLVPDHDFLAIYCECDIKIREQRYNQRSDPKPTFAEKDALDMNLGTPYTRKAIREKEFVYKEGLTLDTSAPPEETLAKVDAFLIQRLFDQSAPVLNPLQAAVLGCVKPIIEKQLQPNGIELTVGEVYRIDGELTISETQKEMATRQKLKPNEQGFFVLEFDQAYEIVFAETVTVPENSFGLSFPRSTFLRNGCLIQTTVWDTGYVGKGSCVVRPQYRVRVAPNTRIVQILFFKCDSFGQYKGNYQGERLNK